MADRSYEVGNMGLTLGDVMPPDFNFLDRYQERVWGLIQWDKAMHTIQGRHPVPYFLDGLIEEVDEITGRDRVEPNYSRFGAILNLEGVENLMPGEQTENSVLRHLKEFGDTSWYLANYLKYFNIPFSRTIEPGLIFWQLDYASNLRSDIDSQQWLEQNHSWFAFLGRGQELLTAARGMTRALGDNVYPKKYEDRHADEKRLVAAAGSFTLSMILILRNRFGITYEEVLQQNIDKITKRIEDGTVFEKSGGDDR